MEFNIMMTDWCENKLIDIWRCVLIAYNEYFDVQVHTVLILYSTIVMSWLHHFGILIYGRTIIWPIPKIIIKLIIEEIKVKINENQDLSIAIRIIKLEYKN